MRGGIIFIGVLGIVSSLFCSGAAADAQAFRFKLPHCPDQLTLRTPAAFSGATNQQSFIDHYNTDPATRDIGAAVLALSGPAQPSLFLFITEPSYIRATQGKVTVEEFEQLKSRILATDGSKEAAEMNERAAPVGIAMKNLKVLKRSSSDNSVRWMGVIRQTISQNGAEEAATYYLGSMVGYRKKCVSIAILVAPASSMSVETFGELIDSLSLE